MTENRGNKNQGNPGNQQDQDDEINLETLLAEVGAEAKIQIIRLEPRWCDGLLTTIDVDADSPISTEEIREEWGGRKLRINILRPNGSYKASRMLKFPDPPKKNGRILKYTDVNPNHDDNGNGNRPPAMPQPSAWDGMKDMLGLMLQSQQNVTTIMQSVYENRIAGLERTLGLPQPSATQPEQRTGLEQVKESLEVLAELQGMQEQILGNRPADSEPSMAERMTSQFFDMMMERERTKADMAMQAARDRMKPAPPIQPPERTEKPKAGRSVHEIPDLELAVLMRERFNRMTEDQRQAAFAVFMGQYDLGEIPTEPENEDDDEKSDGLDQNNVIDLNQESTSRDSGTVDITPEDAKLLDSLDETT